MESFIFYRKKSTRPRPEPRPKPESESTKPTERKYNHHPTFESSHYEDGHPPASWPRGRTCKLIKNLYVHVVKIPPRPKIELSTKERNEIEKSSTD